MVSKLNCAVFPTLVSAALLGLCQVSLAQDYMLAATDIDMLLSEC